MSFDTAQQSLIDRSSIEYSATSAAKMAADLRAEGKTDVQVEIHNMASEPYWTVRWTEPGHPVPQFPGQVTEIFHPDSPWDSLVACAEERSILIRRVKQLEAEVAELRAKLLALQEVDLMLHPDRPDRALTIYSAESATKIAAALRARGKTNVQVEGHDMAVGQFWTVRWTEPNKP